ncbi:MAG: hypothetical protein U0271_15160 [Polyangiaceae bacterium]
MTPLRALRVLSLALPVFGASLFGCAHPTEPRAQVISLSAPPPHAETSASNTSSLRRATWTATLFVERPDGDLRRRENWSFIERGGRIELGGDAVKDDATLRAAATAVLERGKPVDPNSENPPLRRLVVQKGDEPAVELSMDALDKVEAAALEAELRKSGAPLIDYYDPVASRSRKYDVNVWLAFNELHPGENPEVSLLLEVDNTAPSYAECSAEALGKLGRVTFYDPALRAVGIELRTRSIPALASRACVARVNGPSYRHINTAEGAPRE